MGGEEGHTSLGGNLPMFNGISDLFVAKSKKMIKHKFTTSDTYSKADDDDRGKNILPLEGILLERRTNRNAFPRLVHQCTTSFLFTNVKKNTRGRHIKNKLEAFLTNLSIC